MKTPWLEKYWVPYILHWANNVIKNNIYEVMEGLFFLVVIRYNFWKNIWSSHAPHFSSVVLSLPPLSNTLLILVQHWFRLPYHKVRRVPIRIIRVTNIYKLCGRLKWPSLLQITETFYHKMQFRIFHQVTCNEMIVFSFLSFFNCVTNHLKKIGPACRNVSLIRGSPSKWVGDPFCSTVKYRTIV